MSAEEIEELDKLDELAKRLGHGRVNALTAIANQYGMPEHVARQLVAAAIEVEMSGSTPAENYIRVFAQMQGKAPTAELLEALQGRLHPLKTIANSLAKIARRVLLRR